MQNLCDAFVYLHGVFAYLHDVFAYLHGGFAYFHGSFTRSEQYFAYSCTLLPSTCMVSCLLALLYHLLAIYLPYLQPTCILYAHVHFPVFHLIHGFADAKKILPIWK